MARLTLRVTEVNDLSKDGASNKRVVLEAKTGAFDGTGPQYSALPPPEGPVADVPFVKGVPVVATLTLVIPNATQASYFGLGTLHTMEFAAIPMTDADKAKAAKDAK
jgi:hypothetical protein